MNRSTIVFFALGHVEVEQARFSLLFGRRRRMSSDLRKRLAGSHAARDLVKGVSLHVLQQQIRRGPHRGVESVGRVHIGRDAAAVL